MIIPNMDGNSNQKQTKQICIVINILNKFSLLRCRWFNVNHGGDFRRLILWAQWKRKLYAFATWTFSSPLCIKVINHRKSQQFSDDIQFSIIQSQSGICCPRRSAEFPMRSCTRVARAIDQANKCYDWMRWPLATLSLPKLTAPNCRCQFSSCRLIFFLEIKRLRR